MDLNNKLLETLEVKQFKYYPVSGQLEPADNELRFHVQEGTRKTSGDEREIALGVNAVRLVD